MSSEPWWSDLTSPPGVLGGLAGCIGASLLLGPRAAPTPPTLASALQDQVLTGTELTQLWGEGSTLEITAEQLTTAGLALSEPGAFNAAVFSPAGHLEAYVVHGDVPYPLPLGALSTFSLGEGDTLRLQRRGPLTQDDTLALPVAPYLPLL